ncbi:MAG TPA: DUF3455 domain-containing protein [Aliidongia sp.]|nr:DUF3455 domain-containing protein [Aliidongia sp.]
MNGRQLIMAAMAGLLLSAGVVRAAEPVPAELQPPAGLKLLFKAKADGVQIYDGTNDGGTLKWTLEAPLARLTGEHGKLVIHHYAGPSWEADDGSKTVRDKDEKVISTPAPNAQADIPWLLIKVTPDPAAGVMSKVTYVQRIATKGGVAPAAAPVRPDTKVGIPYTATYAFYGKAD